MSSEDEAAEPEAGRDAPDGDPPEDDGAPGTIWWWTCQCGWSTKSFPTKKEAVHAIYAVGGLCEQHVDRFHPGHPSRNPGCFHGDSPAGRPPVKAGGGQAWLGAFA